MRKYTTFRQQMLNVVEQYRDTSTVKLPELKSIADTLSNRGYSHSKRIEKVKDILSKLDLNNRELKYVENMLNLSKAQISKYVSKSATKHENRDLSYKTSLETIESVRNQYIVERPVNNIVSTEPIKYNIEHVVSETPKAKDIVGRVGNFSNSMRKYVMGTAAAIGIGTGIALGLAAVVSCNKSNDHSAAATQPAPVVNFRTSNGEVKEDKLPLAVEASTKIESPVPVKSENKESAILAYMKNSVSHASKMTNTLRDNMAKQDFRKWLTSPAAPTQILQVEPPFVKPLPAPEVVKITDSSNDSSQAVYKIISSKSFSHISFPIASSYVEGSRLSEPTVVEYVSRGSFDTKEELGQFAQVISKIYTPAELDSNAFEKLEEAAELTDSEKASLQSLNAKELDLMGQFILASGNASYHQGNLRNIIAYKNSDGKTAVIGDLENIINLRRSQR